MLLSKSWREVRYMFVCECAHVYICGYVYMFMCVSVCGGGRWKFGVSSFPRNCPPCVLRQGFSIGQAIADSVTLANPDFYLSLSPHHTCPFLHGSCQLDSDHYACGASVFLVKPPLSPLSQSQRWTLHPKLENRRDTPNSREYTSPLLKIIPVSMQSIPMVLLLKVSVNDVSGVPHIIATHSVSFLYIFGMPDFPNLRKLKETVVLKGKKRRLETWVDIICCSCRRHGFSSQYSHSDL